MSAELHMRQKGEDAITADSRVLGLTMGSHLFRSQISKKNRVFQSNCVCQVFFFFFNGAIIYIVKGANLKCAV